MGWDGRHKYLHIADEIKRRDKFMENGGKKCQRLHHDEVRDVIDALNLAAKVIAEAETK